MKKQALAALNDLTTLFTARGIAIPLILLLLFKIYSLAPESLIYVMCALLLTAAGSIRWSLHYIVNHKLVFAKLYNKSKKDSQV